jgi:hypothetical protein
VWHWEGLAHLGPHFPKPDSSRAYLLAPAAHDSDVPVLEEGANFVSAYFDRDLASRRKLEQGAGFTGRRSRLSTGAEEITRL